MGIPTAGKSYVPFGPCNVSWGAATLSANGTYPVTPATTFELLGTSDTADSANITEQWHQYRPTISDFGPAIFIPPYRMGEIHMLRIPLVNFDILQLIALRNAVLGTSTDGVHGAIGTALKPITLQFEATLPGSQNRIYPLCWIEQNAVDVRGFQYGQNPVRLLTAVAMTNVSSPPAATDVTYTTTYN